MIVGLVSIIGAMIFKHISFSVFLNPAALCVIFLGTVACVMNSFTGREMRKLGVLFKIIFSKDTDSNKVELVNRIVNIAETARREGLLALEGKAGEIEDSFFRKGLQLIVDGSDVEYVREVLYLEMEAMEERHNLNASMFTSAGTYAPTLGVMGAVFGLIAAMSYIDNTAYMANAIAAAFIATILGIFTGYVMWNPFATKLKVKTKHELVEKNMIVEGLVALQKGESPILIKEKLMSFLTTEERKQFERESTQL